MPPARALRLVYPEAIQAGFSVDPPKMLAGLSNHKSQRTLGFPDTPGCGVSRAGLLQAPPGTPNQLLSQGSHTLLSEGIAEVRGVCRLWGQAESCSVPIRVGPGIPGAL